jgi:hypothetical protein
MLKSYNKIMIAKIKYIILRVGLILIAFGLLVLGVVTLNDIAIGTPIFIIVGILLLIVVIVRWKDLENIGK